MARYSLDSSALPHPAHYKPHYPVNSRSEKNGLQSLLSELDRRRKTNITAKSSSSSAPFVSALKNKSSVSSGSKNNKSYNRDNDKNKTAPIKPWLLKQPLPAASDKKDKASSFSFLEALPKDVTSGALVRRPSAPVSKSDDESGEDSDSGDSDGSEDSTSDDSDGSEDSTSDDSDDGNGSDRIDSTSSGDDESEGSEDTNENDKDNSSSHNIKNSKDSKSGHNDDNTRTREAGINCNAFNPWRAASKSCTARPPLSAFRLPPFHPIPEAKLVKPNPVELKPPATPSHYAPSKLARSKMAARPSLEDDAALFKQIESRHMSKINHGSAFPTTTTRTKLWSEPGAASLELASYRSSPPDPRPPSQKHIQDATQRSWELLQKKNAKRQLDQKRVEPSNKRVKFGESDSKTAAYDAPPPTKSHVQKVLPLERTRTITQYTVFETRRLALPFDGQLRDKVLRRESFLDKHKANRFAARLMPKAEYVQSTVAITRIEFDYGMGDAERDGMFLGRVYYNRDKKEEIKFVFVDRELQQLGKMSVADLEKEVSNRDLSAEYVQAFLAVRFDVFVVLRKAIQHDDGRMVVYAYDETEAEIHTREDVDSGDEEEEEEEEAEPRQEKEVQTESEDDQIALGSHFEHLLQGSYTTQSDANTKALDAFEEWTQPPSDRPRLDAVIYHRDYIKPDIAQRRIAANVDGSHNAENIAASKLDVESIELSWEPPPQFGYGYSSISVVVTKSQMQGPLDLTGAFKTG